MRGGWKRRGAWIGTAFLVLGVARLLVGNDVLHWWAGYGR